MTRTRALGRQLQHPNRTRLTAGFRSNVPHGPVLSHTRRGLQQLREQDPPLVWGDVDADTAEELWWLLPSGLNELDRLETSQPGS